MSRHHLVLFLLVLAGCPGPVLGPDDGGVPEPADGGRGDAGQVDDAGRPDDGGLLEDAGHADAGPSPAPFDGGVHFLDWLTERGAPLSPVVEAEVSGRAFALSDTAYAVESDCDAGACTYTWYTSAGAVLRRHVGLSPVATDSFSPDGTKFAAVEVSTRFVCSAMGASLPLVEGTWGLYDGLTGERLTSSGPLVSDPGLINSAFTRHGSIVRRERYDRVTCEQVESTPLLTTPPYTVPEALAGAPTDPGQVPYVEDDLADGRLVVSGRVGLTMPLGVMRPRDGSSYVSLDADHQTFRESGGFLHVLGGWPLTRVATLPPAGAPAPGARLPSNEAFFNVAVFSKQFVMACAQDRPGERRCDAVDGLGVLPPRRTTTGAALPAVAGTLALAVYATPDGGVERLDLSSGARSALDVPATTVRPAGRGDGFLLSATERAWGLTRGAPFPLGERVRAVLSGATQVEQPQSDVVFIVSSNDTGSRTFLDVWNVKESRVARVTDQLVFNPPFNAPFTADTSCGAPGFLRSLGPSLASASQPGRFIHFTTSVPGPQPKLEVFVMPSDLSAPPRRIAELDPDQCSPPLISPSGRRLWLPVVTNDGVRVVLATL